MNFLNLIRFEGTTSAGTTATTVAEGQPPLRLASKQAMHGGDIALLVLYLVLILGMGLFLWWWQWYKRQNKTTNHFFTGGGRNPVIVVALSMWATILSSIFFVNAAGQAAETAWMWSGANIALIAITPFIAIFVIPFYRRLKESTAYAYLEKRFHYSLRAVNSLSFIVFQIFRTAVVLFVPVVALTTVVDVSPYVIIIVVGLIIIIISAFGGFKAVLWTDAIQGVILLVGIFSVVIAALAKTNWGSENLQYQIPLTKKSWQLSATQGGISLLFVYNIINSMYAFMGSQDVTQRYKGTKSIYQIRKTLYISSFLGIIAILLFFGAGSALFTYYKANYNIDTMTTDGFKSIGAAIGKSQFMINFIATALPVGFVGFILAAVFAASQSTVSSGLSALANSIMVDFVLHWAPKLSNFWSLIISKSIITFFGSLAILFGCVLIYTKQNDLFDYFTGIVGLLNAPTVAVFVMGLYSRKSHWIGALVGMFVGISFGIPLWVFSQKFLEHSPYHINFSGVYLTFVTFFSTWIFGYGVSLVLWYLNIRTNPKILVNRTMLDRTPEFKRLTKMDAEIGKFEKWVKSGRIKQEDYDLAGSEISTTWKSC